MKELNEISEIFKNLFGLNGNMWVKRKNISSMNIETCNGISNDDELANTCYVCVALNDTIFKNNNKPDFFHYRCKCKNIPTTYNSVKLDFPKEKISKYLLSEKGKLGLMQSMGYSSEDADYLYNTIAENAKKKFYSGEYILGSLNIYGQKVNIELELKGKGLKENQTYRFITGWTAYPNGKLHNNTPFGGWAE